MLVPRTVAPFTRRDVLYLVLCLVVLAALVIAFDIHKTRVFESMTPAQHLAEAKSSLAGAGSIGEAREHLLAIPPKASEAPEAAQILKDLDAREKAFDSEVAAGRAANAGKSAQQKEEAEARSAMVSLLQSSLRDLGYDVVVSLSDTGEVVITSSEFDDSDHRVRFLSFLRGKKSPVLGVCFGSFTRVRLRSSRMPVVGFSESYSLEC